MVGKFTPEVTYFGDFRHTRNLENCEVLPLLQPLKKGSIADYRAHSRSFLGANTIGLHYEGHGGEDGVFEYKDLPRPKAVVHYDNEVTAVYCVGGDGGFVT